MDDGDGILEFGIKRENEERRDGGCGVVFDPVTQKYAVSIQPTNGKLRLFAGGVDPDEDLEKGVLREVTEESGLYDFHYVEKITEVMAHYHNSLRKVNRVTKSTCFLVILKSTNLVDVKHEEHETFDLHWATVEELFANWKLNNTNNDYDHYFHFFKKAVPRAKELGYDKTSNIDLLQ
jgi:8-oxo-dGTP pyrophosphatase MutT (NUDIX family)